MCGQAGAAAAWAKALRPESPGAGGRACIAPAERASGGDAGWKVSGWVASPTAASPAPRCFLELGVHAEPEVGPAS